MIIQYYIKYKYPPFIHDTQVDDMYSYSIFDYKYLLYIYIYIYI